LLTGDEKTGVYEIELTRDWVKKSAPVLKTLSNTLSLALPIAGSGALPNTGQWDTMRRTVVSNGLSIPEAGNYTIRIVSVGGPGAWQWNADRLAFRELTSNVYGGTTPAP